MPLGLPCRGLPFMWGIYRLRVSGMMATKGPKYSILIADDDSGCRDALRSIVEAEGYRTVLAGSGEEALDIVHEELVDLAYSVAFSRFSALGILLYQMAVGDLARPLAGGWERGIADELLREDIAACVEGDPQRRLASAADLSTRLRTLDAP